VAEWSQEGGTQGPRKKRGQEKSSGRRAETENEDDRRLVAGGMVAEGEQSGSRGNSITVVGPESREAPGGLMVNVNPKC
jgi:hypothetical protein